MIDIEKLDDALKSLDRLEKHMNEHGSFGDNGEWDVCRDAAKLLRDIWPHIEPVLNACRYATNRDFYTTAANACAEINKILEG